MPGRSGPYPGEGRLHGRSARLRQQEGDARHEGRDRARREGGARGRARGAARVPLVAEEAPEAGQQVTVDAFEVGDRVKVTGTSKGKGFQGVMKRHGFAGGRASHGATRIHRAPGSIGAGTNPSRVIKGKKMPGHMGDAQRTVRNLRVAKIDAERNLLYVRGALPGPTGGVLFIREAIG